MPLHNFAHSITAKWTRGPVYPSIRPSRVPPKGGISRGLNHQSTTTLLCHHETTLTRRPTASDIRRRERYDRKLTAHFHLFGNTYISIKSTYFLLYPFFRVWGCQSWVFARGPFLHPLERRRFSVKAPETFHFRSLGMKTKNGAGKLTTTRRQRPIRLIEFEWHFVVLQNLC